MVASESARKSERITVFSIDFRRLTAPAFDKSLLILGVFSFGSLGAALVSLVAGSDTMPTGHFAVAILGVIGLAVWGLLKSSMALEDIRDPATIQTRWRRFLGIDEPARGAPLP